MKLSQFSVSRPVASLMLFLVLLIFGVISFFLLPIDLMPKMEMPTISVITGWAGASCEDVEMQVTKKIENELSTLNNLKELNSTTKEGLSIVTCAFNFNGNLAEAVNDVREKVEFVKMRLPSDIKDPMIFKFNTSMMPIAIFGVIANESFYQMQDLIDDEVVTSLKRIDGVGAVQLIGDKKKQVHVKLDKNRLAGLNISLLEIEKALNANNLNMPAGSIVLGDTEYMIRIPGEFTHLDQISHTIVRKLPDANIYLKDLAQIDFDFKDNKRFVEINHKNAMMLFIQKRSGSNTIEVVKNIKAKIQQIKPKLPRDIEFPIIMDSSEFINLSVYNLLITVVFAFFFVSLITYLFYGSWRSSLAILLTIPLACFVAFGFMYYLDWSLNIISLAALAIALGMVVDNAIVVLDNISKKSEFCDLKKASIEGSSEVGLAISASTLTTIVIFLPLVFVSNIIGVMFKQLGGIVAITLLASLFAALAFTPMFASKLLKKQKNGSFKLVEKIFYKLGGFYKKLLQITLVHKKKTLALALIFFLFSLLLMPFIGTEFMPADDTGMLTVTIEMPVGTPADKTAAVCKRVEDFILHTAGMKNIEYTFFHCGVSDNKAGAAFGRKEAAYMGQCGIKLVKLAQRDFSTKDLAVKIAPFLHDNPSIAKFNVDADDPMSKMIMGSGKSVTIEILGHDLKTAEDLASQVWNLAENTPGASNITVSLDVGKPELVVMPDRIKAASLGVDILNIAQTLRTYFYGKDTSKFRTLEHEYDIHLKLGLEQRSFLEDIKSVEILNNYGQKIRLDNIASIEEKKGPIEITRANQQRVVRVELDTYKKSSGEVARKLKDKIARNILVPENFKLAMGGMAKEQNESFKYLKYMFLLGLLLVYMVMAAQFESLKNPFIIMFSVPFALTGGFLALFIFQTNLSVLSFVGMVMLIGIVVNNGIVLVDCINQLRAEMPLKEAILSAGEKRLRPVLATTLTTICGMLPLIFSRGEGSAMWRPLGVTVFGGLLLSTLVTLLLIPVLFAIFNKDKTALQKEKK